jgi:hypothetical protein
MTLDVRFWCCQQLGHALGQAALREAGNCWDRSVDKGLAGDLMFCSAVDDPTMTKGKA